MRKNLFISPIFVGLLNIFLGAVAFAPLPSYALEVQNFSVPGFGSIQKITTLGDVFYFLYGFALLLAGVALFSSLFAMGVQFMTSGADPGKRIEAKKRFTGAVVGTTLLLGMFLFLKMINPGLISLSSQTFQFCSPNCPQVSFPLLGSGSSSTGSTSGTTTTSLGSGTCALITANDNPCAVGKLNGADLFGVQANNASIICNAESGGGNPLALNPTTYAAGLFQINLSAHCSCSGSSPSCKYTQVGPINLSCADNYGTPLAFNADGSAYIDPSGVDTAKQIRGAVALWNSTGQHFCGPHPPDCSSCGTWVTAQASICSICPN